MDLKILIIEDERPAAKRLEQLVRQLRPETLVAAVIESVVDAVEWLNNHPQPDLIFLDIHLADGLSFDIFPETKVSCPVIFTTAYDQYALKAFKLNSVDYLLKPIDPEELREALDKFDRLQPKNPSLFLDPQILRQLAQGLQQPEYKQRFLIKMGNSLGFAPVVDFRYFYSEDSRVFGRLYDGKRHHLDYTLEALEAVLNPQDFFRINRKIILHAEAVQRIHPYFNNRLKLEVQPDAGFEVIVSRERVTAFKQWMDR